MIAARPVETVVFKRSPEILWTDDKARNVAPVCPAVRRGAVCKCDHAAPNHLPILTMGIGQVVAPLRPVHKSPWHVPPESWLSAWISALGLSVSRTMCFQ